MKAVDFDISSRIEISRSYGREYEDGCLLGCHAVLSDSAPKFIDVSERLAASIAILMTQAASMSETSVNFYQITRRNSPESS
jgi:hypothetical protein